MITEEEKEKILYSAYDFIDEKVYNVYDEDEIVTQVVNYDDVCEMLEKIINKSLTKDE